MYHNKKNFLLIHLVILFLKFQFANFVVNVHASSLTNLKGTVRVISSEPPCKDANARFTTSTHEVLAEGPGFAREKKFSPIGQAV